MSGSSLAPGGEALLPGELSAPLEAAPPLGERLVWSQQELILLCSCLLRAGWRAWELPVHPLHGSPGFFLGEMSTGQEPRPAQEQQCHQACGSPQSKGINLCSWLCPSQLTQAADGKAGRTLLGSRPRAQLFPDKDFVLGSSPVGSRLQIPAVLILPLRSPPAPRISSKLIQVIGGIQLPGRAGTGQGCILAFPRDVEWQSGNVLGAGSPPGTSTQPGATHTSCFPCGCCPGKCWGCWVFRAVEKVPWIEVGAEEKGGHVALRLAPCCCMTEFYGVIPQIFQVLSPQQGLRACGGSVLLCQELGEGGEAAAPTKTGRGGHTISSLLANKSNF